MKKKGKCPLGIGNDNNTDIWIENKTQIFCLLRKQLVYVFFDTIDKHLLILQKFHLW